MRNSWPIKTIAECAASEPYSTQIGPFGKALMADEYAERGVPVLRGVNVNSGRFHDDDFVFINEETANKLRKFESYPGDVLLVHKGTLGEIGLMPKKRKYDRYIMGNSMMRVQCDRTKLLPEYLYYWLSSAQGMHYLLSRVSQVGVPQIQTPLTTLREAKLPVPPIEEQRIISRVLTSLDEKIESSRRMNGTLEAMGQAVFKSRFIEAIQDGLPAGWRECTVSDEFNLTMGQSPPGETYNEIGEGLPFYQGRADFGFRYPTERVFCTAPTRFAEAGDTLVSVRAPVGSMNMTRTKCCIGRGVAAVRHKAGSCSYTYYFMRSLEPEFACFEAEGTVFGAINKADFCGIACTAPPASVVDEFENLIHPVDQLIESNEVEFRALALLRDALLPKLLSGEVRVSNDTRQL